ncbi:hypothetical protein AAVH_40753, partial [Aphelenchoides avenae]
VHEHLRQHAERIHDELERKDLALQAEIKRMYVSSAVIEKLRQELRQTALEAELRLKDFELQNEVQRVDLLSESVHVLRE